METPDSDEIRPTSVKPDEPTTNPTTPPAPVDSPSIRIEDVNATQPTHVSPAEPSMDDTQLSTNGDDGLNLPPEIPGEPAPSPRSSRRWILWAFLGVLVLVLIAAGSAFAGYNSAIEERTHSQ